MGNQQSQLLDPASNGTEFEDKLETNVGVVGQSISDLFFPDNPNRRRRINQSYIDISLLDPTLDIADSLQPIIQFYHSKSIKTNDYPVVQFQLKKIELDQLSCHVEDVITVNTTSSFPSFLLS